MNPDLKKLIKLHELDLAIAHLNHQHQKSLSQTPSVEPPGTASLPEPSLGSEEQKSQMNTMLKNLTADREKIASEIPKRLLKEYEHIKGRHGMALAQVVNESCQGCRLVVRVAVREKVRMGEQLVRCEFCGRIFYSKPSAPSIPAPVSISS